MDSCVKWGSLIGENGCSRVFVLWVSDADRAALDIMRSAGAEPTVGRTLEVRIAIGLATPGTVPLIMSAIFGNLAEE